jgi:hypothetical protein
MEDDVSVDSETLLITDFMNLKIKLGSIFQMCSEKYNVRAYVYKNK